MDRTSNLIDTVIAALDALAEQPPADATETLALVTGLHRTPTDPSIINSLTGLCDALTQWLADAQVPGLEGADAETVSGYLESAGSTISGAANDWLLRARENLVEITGGEW
jgi:hypothetical protein